MSVDMVPKLMPLETLRENQKIGDFINRFKNMMGDQKSLKIKNSNYTAKSQKMTNNHVPNQS